MAFERPDIQTIYGRIKADMEARVSSNVKIPRFSLLGIIIMVFAGAIHLVYGYVVFISDQLFVDTATTTWLDRLANMYGVPRKAGTFAQGEITVFGVDGTVIPEGTEFQSDAGIRYATVSEETIPPSEFVEIEVQSVTEGEIGNTEETNLFLVSPITGVETQAVVVVPIEGGVDTETDAELRIRLLQRLQNPPSSGTAADYERWALEVSGVGKAWTIPAEQYNGTGTVGVVLGTSSLDPVPGLTKTEVEANIESNRPVGAKVDVLDLESVEIGYFISISPNTEGLRENVQENLQNLHLSEAGPGFTILLSHIRSAIAASGVVDYEITDIEKDAVSQGVANIETDGVEVAKFSTVTFADL